MENKTLYRGINIYIYRGCFKQLREEKKTDQLPVAA